MADPQQTVFISYRRNVSAFVARAVFMNLRQHGYDVFMDVESIDSGQFGTIILNQIAARVHFLVILTPGTLEKCQEPGDWLRREIECAIVLKRNVVPILAHGFHFEDNASAHLTGALCELPGYNGVTLLHDYFDAAMERLRTRFLKQPGQGGITPAPPKDAPVVQQKIEEVASRAAPTKQELLAEEYVNRAGVPVIQLPQFPEIDKYIETTLNYVSSAKYLKSKFVGRLIFSSIIGFIINVTILGGSESYQRWYDTGGAYVVIVISGLIALMVLLKIVHMMRNSPKRGSSNRSPSSYKNGTPLIK